MDETLNRPLFRNRARHYEQIKNADVKKYNIGGVIVGTGALASKYAPRIYQASKAGIKAFKEAREARNLPPSLYEKFATKYPKITGGSLTTLGAAQVGEGGYDVYKGIQEEDPAKIAEGGAGIFFGTPIARTGISRFKTGKPKYENIVKETLPGVGLYGASMVLPMNELKRIQDAQIEQYETENGVKLNPSQRKEAESIIAKEYEQQPKSTLELSFPGLSNVEIIEGRQPKTTLDVAFPGLSNVDIIEGKGRQDPVNLFSDVSRNIVQQSNDAKSIPPGGLSKEEIISTLENDEKKRKQGENLKLKTSKKEEKGGSGFQKFYEEFDEQIGGSREISDLIMYKLATGLLTGTTTKSGFAGFADVLGKAGGDVLDTAILLASKEKDRKASLFEAYVKAQKANDGKSSVGTERYTIQIPDETAVFGKRNVTIARFKDGTDAKAIESNEIDPNTGKPLIDYVPLEFNPNAIELPKVSAKDLDERRAALNQVAGSYRMASTVAKADLGTVGAAGSIKLFKEKIIGSISDVLDNEITPAGYNKDSDLFVNTEILGKGVKKADGTFISAREAIAEKEKLINQIANKEKSIFGRPSPNELEKLIRNARYEVNFAYAYANSLKAEDRLTEKNLEDAKKVSAIFGLKSSKSIIEQFKQLADDADDKFKQEANRYLDIGGNNAYFEQNFEDIPSFKKEKNLRGGLQKRKEIQQNLMKGVETLPDKYK